MAVPTVTEQRERLEAVLEASGLVETLLTSQDVPIPDGGLPAYAVTARGGSRARRSSDIRDAIRTFEVLVLYVALPARPTPEDQRDAIIAVEDVMEGIPDYLEFKAPRLNVDGKPFDSMSGFDEITDDGAQIYEWGGTTYGGVVYNVPVKITRMRRV